MSNFNENPLETPASNLTGENVTDAAQQRVVADTNPNLILPGNDADVNTPGKDVTTMNNNFRHGFYTLGSVFSERILCDADEMLRMTWKNQGILVGREAYMSAFTYPDEFADFVNENIRINGTAKGCTKGYDGPCGADYLLVDIDREGNLQAAFDDTVKLVQHLEWLGLASESVMVAFSGGKGTHLYVPIPVFGEAASPSITLNAECRKVAEKLAGAAGITIDSMIYDKNRLFRAPNSLHPKTGLYKIFVTVDELTVPNAVESVSTRATSPRLLTDIPQENCPDVDTVCYTPPSEAPLADFWRLAVTEVKAVPGVTLENATISPVAEKYRNLQTDYARNRIIKFLEASQPAIQGREGDKTLFTLACRLVDGFALDVPVATEYIMAHWNHKAVPPWDEKDVRYKCESAQKYVEPDRPRGYLWEEGNARYGADTSPGVCAQNNAWQDTNLRDPATFQDFPLECLPEPVNRYVREKARALNQNPSGLAYALLVLAGACVGAKVKLKLGIDRLTAAILWFALIGISGSGKTPLINSCVALVSEMESIWHKQYVKEMRVYEREKAEYERSLKSKVVRARAGNEECVHVQPPPPKTEANLREFFGADCELEKITPKRADDFSSWLRTAPLNRLRSGDKPYSTATINKRIGYVKQLFRYAVQIDWLPKNPFTYVKGGESVNPSRWMYVAGEMVERVIEVSHLPRWRAIIALGRFAGVRGSSELYGLLWEHVQWSSENEPGSLLIKAEKNKRHGRQFRTVPMHPVVERELSTLFHQAKEGETHVFPGMAKETNLGTMTRKLVLQAGIPVWPNVWYNLRKSFCCDLMETGIDPTAYEAITDHSYTVAMKHYQIPHTKRLQRGYEKILASWRRDDPPAEPSDIPTVPESLPRVA